MFKTKEFEKNWEHYHPILHMGEFSDVKLQGQLFEEEQRGSHIWQDLTVGKKLVNLIRTGRKRSLYRQEKAQSKNCI